MDEGGGENFDVNFMKGRRDMKNMVAGSIAEFVGTFTLMFAGGGAIIMTAAMPGGGGGLLAVALAHGLALAVMISATMHISGGQLNPAVTFGVFVGGKQGLGKSIVFVISQVLGSVVAAFILKSAFGSVHAAGGDGLAVEAAKLGATLGGMGLGTGVIYLLEVIATFFLVFTVFGTAVDQRGVGKGPMVGGFAIGLTVMMDILMIGPATGASMNPARSFGPALVGGYWDIQWLYWLAPLTGGLLAALVWRFGIGLGDEG